MSETHVETIYTSCACNRTPNILDWSLNDVIAFGACNSVVIWNHHAGKNKIIQTLCKHKDRVNCVRWIQTLDVNQAKLLSASTDGTAIVWRRIDNNYVCAGVLSGHGNSVTIVDGIYLNDKLIVATASVDATVKIWKETEDGFQCVQTIEFNNGMCINLRLHKIRDENRELPILACSTSNSKINLYSSQFNSDDCEEINFQIAETLTGHEAWIHGLDFTTDDDGNILLASCSKDRYIRIWKLTKVISVNGNESNRSEDQIKIETKIINVFFGDEKIFTYSVSLESILAGHEGWIYSVQWHPRLKNTQPMKLLSSSLDKTIILWSQDTRTGVWLDSIRLGEVGGNTLGFYGAKYSADGGYILGHGFQGSFHIWKFCEDGTSLKPSVVVGGHFNEAVDLVWEKSGKFLLSVSTDQTTRLHAQWISDNNDKIWHEIARPQIHGYNMSCIAMLGKYRFVSGAEEKVIRVFDAPYNFIENFQNICKVKEDLNGIILPKGASVPSLGLSNKAVYESEEKVLSECKQKEEYPDTSYFTELKLSEPPTEENLLQNTLWPEIQKLYGHGFELYTLAATATGDLLASACKATKFEHAAILLWDTKSWKIMQQLFSHTLTVTQLAFSPDDKKLLSVSRDRRWSLFERNSETNNFELIACTEKKSSIHTRIIWCCCWSFDSRYFATGSRDGKAIIWQVDKVIETNTSLSESVLDIKDSSITAIAIAPKFIENNIYLVVLGFETGNIISYKWCPQNGWKQYQRLEQNEAHHKCVKRLAFRPLLAPEDDVLYLASCGSDHFVRIFEICIR